MGSLFSNIFKDNKNFLVFVIGLLSLVKIRLLGTFGIGELVIFAIFPFVFLKSGIFTNRGVKILFYMLCVWLVGVLFADFYNSTPTDNALKGAFNIIFMLIAVPVVYWLLKDKPRRVIYYWMGNCISCLIGYYFQRVGDMSEFDAEVWRTYAYYPLFIFLSGLLFYKGKKLLAYIIIEGFALWSLWHMSRNIFLTMTLATLFMLMLYRVTESNKFQKIKQLNKHFIPLIFGLIVSLVGVKIVYEQLAYNKVLGEAEYYKYEMQKNSNLGLASGRSDFFQSIYLVSMNPIWGYGSYAREDISVYSKVRNNANIEYDHKTHRVRRDMLSGHSYLMGAWVYSGILGAIFWFYILSVIFKFVNGPIIYDVKLLGLNILLTFSMLWNIFFSPFTDRPNFLFFIILIIIQISNYERAVKTV